MTKIEIHVVSDKGNRETFHFGEQQTAQMVQDFLTDPEKLQRFGECLDENPTFAHLLYRGESIPESNQQMI